VPKRRLITRRSPNRPRQSAIGVFDSGIGGLTVVQALLDVLPHEQLIYLGDTGRTPYGTKSAETVRRFSLENAAFLVEKGIKLLVVACNTVSAVAIEAVRAAVDVPVLGVIEPGAQAAVERTRNRKVGVIGTEATISSGAYTQALKRLEPRLEIYTRACPVFVPLAEEGWTDNDIARATASLYLTSLRHSGIDTLILGCTHYPLLSKVIAEIMGSKVKLVDSAQTTALAARKILTEAGIAKRSGAGSVSFFVTDAPDRFQKVGVRFMGQRVESAVRIER